MTNGEPPVRALYLVELYQPRRSAAESADELDRLRQAVAHVARQGVPVAHVCSLFVPADETCFHLLEASRREAVEQALHGAGIEHERLSEALDLTLIQNGIGA